MKKIIALTAAIIILFSFAACSSSTSSNDNTESKKDKNGFSTIFEKETEKPTYNVTFRANGGTPVNSMKTDKIETEPVTNKNKCVFEGWYFDNDFIQKAIFPLELKQDITLYAKWLLLEEVHQIEGNAVLKNWEGSPYASQVNITPKTLDIDTLSKKGYKININLEYTVYYKKDYEVPLDIGYMGAPKYKVYITGYNENNASSSIYGETDITANKSKSKKSENIEHTIFSIDDCLKNKIILKFSTENIQNKVYIEDIKVTYTCHK